MRAKVLARIVAANLSGIKFVIIELFVIGIVFFAAFAWGANEPWAMGIIASVTLALAAIKLITDIWRRSLEVRCASIYVPLLLFLAYAGCPLLLGPVAGIRFPGTIDRYSTTIYFLLALSYVAIMFIVGNGSRSRSHLKWLVISIIVLGAVESVYGLIQYLGNHEYIWNVRKTAYENVASGTLINQNHYALLMNLCISTTLGYLYYRSTRLAGDMGISLRRLVSMPGAAKPAWIAVWLALMGIALIFSMSRMGIAAMFCSIGAMMIASRIAVRHVRLTAMVAVLLLLAILVAAIYIGVDAVLVRYENLSQEHASEEGRIALWRDAWKMIAEYPVFGRGLGTFRWMYPAYETVRPDTPAQYAHNDYIQALAEVGIIGLSLLIWAFGAVWQTAIRNIRNTTDPLVRGIGIGTIGALTAIALQELVDFGLYIPGVAVTAAFLIGLNIRASALRNREV